MTEKEMSLGDSASAGELSLVQIEEAKARYLELLEEKNRKREGDPGFDEWYAELKKWHRIFERAEGFKDGYPDVGQN